VSPRSILLTYPRKASLASKIADSNNTPTKPKPQKKTDTRSKYILSEALIQSQIKDIQDPLTCEIPKGTINDLNKMAKYLGLISGKTVSEFLKSILFLELYNELFNTVIAPK
jgi:hypothetical protein